MILMDVMICTCGAHNLRKHACEESKEYLNRVDDAPAWRASRRLEGGCRVWLRVRLAQECLLVCCDGHTLHTETLARGERLDSEVAVEMEKVDGEALGLSVAHDGVVVDSRLILTERGVDL